MGKQSEIKTNSVTCPNRELATMLSELGDFEKNKNKAIHKFSAYKKAARAIMDCQTKINSGDDAVKTLKGVGKKIGLKIDEYIKNGKINKLEKERADTDYLNLKQLLRVTGIGPTMARKLVEEGIKNLDDLRANTNKLTHHQKVGLKHVEDFECKIPREEMCQLRDLIVSEAKSIDKDYCLTVCGSFRRGLPASGDIDILITHPTFVSASYEPKTSDLIVSGKKSPKPLLDKIIIKLTERKFITDTLGFGDSKYMGVCCLKVGETKYRRLDIRIVPSDEYYCALLYFTGSDVFNKNMRAIALKKGFTLNEYSLNKTGVASKPVGPPLKVTSELDVFNYLGMEFKAPEDR